MNKQQPSIPRLGKIDYSPGRAKQANQKSIAQLLNDQAALDDWSNNIEKIRQKEAAGSTQQTS